jgi:hypothetical protein
MPNAGKCFLRNHFQGKYFPPKIFYDKNIFQRALSRPLSNLSRVLGRPDWVLIKSRANTGLVPGGSWLGPSRSWLSLDGISSGFWSSPKQVQSGPSQVLARSQAGSRASPEQVLVKSRVCPNQVLSSPFQVWLGLEQVLNES